MRSERNIPPQFFHRFFRWYCKPKLADHIEGDLMEVYNERVRASGKRKADRKFIIDVLLLFRPGIVRPFIVQKNLNTSGMYKSYFKIGWRNLLKHKGYSLINIGGLAAGMTVAMFIGLWIHDELTFNQCHKNYDHIAQMWSGGTDPQTGETGGSVYVEYPIAAVLRNNYQHYFKHVLMVRRQENSLSWEDKKVPKKGMYVDGSAPEMLSLTMLKGSYKSLGDMHSIILSRSAAASIFGDQDPMNKTLRIDNKMEAQVTGIYEDIPRNSSFGEIQYFCPFSLWVSVNTWIKGSENDWDNRPGINVYVQLQPNITTGALDAALKDLFYKNVPADFMKVIDKYKPFPQAIPMSTWHLYSEFKNGRPAMGRITYVWLFGIVGIFVLMLACINFINLSTARSEKRAREVGVRKTIGSGKWQLVLQFLSESLMVVVLAFGFSVVLVTLLQNWFNELSDKDIALPFGDPGFWVIAIAFIVFTGLMAGLYPAFYLSSFRPVKVLKGSFGLGQFTTLPRKILVVVQFTVSVILVIGTVVVYEQIQHARNRPVGYDREGLITLPLDDPGYKGKQNALRSELLNADFISEVSFSSSPLTEIWNTTNGYEWLGKDPNLEANFAICHVTQEFGKTVGWKFLAGRDFSRDLATDSTDAVIINEAAARYMGFKNAVGQELVDVDEFGRPKWKKTIIGVIKDVVAESPYAPVRQAIYYFRSNQSHLMHVKIAPLVSANNALSKLKIALEKVAPAAFFEYKFVDEEYARKFSQEERIGKLSGIFAFLAILISCLGLFGLASFVAEQRTKEIGIRKVMGASVSDLWRMLSKDFVLLVIISCLIAIPVASFLMNQWLEAYEYRTDISWRSLLLTCIAAFAITLLTVSYQSIRAAVMNPVNSLRSE